MTLIILDNKETIDVVEGVSVFVDFEKDLPSRVFVGDFFDFWFFERSLLLFAELFSGLVLESFSSYNTGVVVKFSGKEILAGSCMVFSGVDVESDASLISAEFSDFFGGRVGYPVVLFNKGCDWIAFESAHEELGVIAVRKGSVRGGFSRYLESNFISGKVLAEWASCPTAEGLTARAFQQSYLQTKGTDLNGTYLIVNRLI